MANAALKTYQMRQAMLRGQVVIIIFIIFPAAQVLIFYCERKERCKCAIIHSSLIHMDTSSAEIETAELILRQNAVIKYNINIVKFWPRECSAP
jgi:hypothetical protein